MKPLLIFRHIECEGPGFLAEILSRYDIPWHLVAIDRHDPLPDSLEDCSGLVFMGGPMSVNDDHPWIRQELSLIRSAFRQGLPVLGHCLGGQLISKALGGQVTANPLREIGWHPVRSCRGPVADDWLEGSVDDVELFHWHGETFSVPDGAALILEDEWCAHQAFAIGNILALQCHVEMTASMVREWVKLYQDELDDPSPAVQSCTEIHRDLEKRIAAMQAVAATLYRRWLRPVLQARKCNTHGP
jgi:GMP synthase-like glutamine amidotransferase